MAKKLMLAVSPTSRSLTAVDSSQESMTRDQPIHIVLVGGGLSHCVALRVLHDLLTCGNSSVRMTLISAWPLTYFSAMLPGLLCGSVPDEGSFIDLRALTTACDADFILATVVKIDASQRQCWLHDGRTVTYDVLSVNTGSRTRGTESLPGVSSWALTPRPVSLFLEKVEELDRKCRDSQQPQLVVVGSGISGLELACSLKRRLESHLSRPVHALLLARERLSVAEDNPVMLRTLTEQNITLVRNCVPLRVASPEVIELKDGRRISGDVLVFATGPEPHPLESDLQRCSQGFFLVTQYLQSVSHPHVFAAGDCVTVQGLPHGCPHKTGAEAIHQGPFLALNILAYTRCLLSEFPLSLLRYEPLPGGLKVIDVGNCVGIALCFDMVFAARWAYQMKREHDVGFIEKFAPEQLIGKNAQQKSQSRHHCGKQIPDDSYLSSVQATRTCSVSPAVQRLCPESALSILSNRDSPDTSLPAQILQRLNDDLQFRQATQAAYAKSFN